MYLYGHFSGTFVILRSTLQLLLISFLLEAFQFPSPFSAEPDKETVQFKSPCYLFPMYLLFSPSFFRVEQNWIWYREGQLVLPKMIYEIINNSLLWTGKKTAEKVYDQCIRNNKWHGKSEQGMLMQYFSQYKSLAALAEKKEKAKTVQKYFFYLCATHLQNWLPKNDCEGQKVQKDQTHSQRKIRQVLLNT